MPLLDPADPRPIHFQGIGGAGMSALAELLHRRGAASPAATRILPAPPTSRRSACRWRRGMIQAHVEGHRALVVSSAIPKDHPEVLRAHVLGIPVVRRAEALAEATAGAR
jgi:UDP-N-acetylmuramate--alanine ligase